MELTQELYWETKTKEKVEQQPCRQKQRIKLNGKRKEINYNIVKTDRNKIYYSNGNEINEWHANILFRHFHFLANKGIKAVVQVREEHFKSNFLKSS